MRTVTLLAIAGALGTLARYGLAVAVQRLHGTPFPWGTFSVNIVGAFLFGLLWSLAEQRTFLSGDTRLILLTGFMGAFTTFSTFMFESSQLLRDTEWLLAAGNLGGQIIIGLVAIFAGLALGRLL
jgi:CrcB protein